MKPNIQDAIRDAAGRRLAGEARPRAIRAAIKIKSPGKSFPVDPRLALRLNPNVQCVSIIPLSIHLVPVRLSWPGFYLNPLRGIIVVAKGSNAYRTFNLRPAQPEWRSSV